MKRLREIAPAELAYAPARLLGGFICVDFHLGCLGCAWCLNRRDPVLHALLESGKHLDLHDIGIPPEEVALRVAASAAFSCARVPLRIGHLTDWIYEVPATARFLRALPDNYPAVALTRFPLNPLARQTLDRQGNLLAHLTLTPRRGGLNLEGPAPERLIQSCLGLPVERLFFMFRPLVEGDNTEVEELLELLPQGSHVAFHGLSLDAIPWDSPRRTLSGRSILALGQKARALGLRPRSHFGCALRALLGVPFFKVHELLAQEDPPCPSCPNHDRCLASLRPIDPSSLQQACSELGIEPKDYHDTGALLLLRTDTPAARADEIYLSERLTRDLRLSSLPREEQQGIQTIDARVTARWRERAIMPRVEDLSARIGNALQALA